MVKILSRDGQSLADIYDVEGSIAGIEQLETRELPIVHEMGATVLSERFTTRIFRIATGDLLQNITFRVQLDTLPETPTRLLGISVFADAPARLDIAAVLATDPTVGQDMPIWVWNANDQIAELISMEDLGVQGNFSLLIPQVGVNIFPSFTGGREQQDNMVSSLTLTGITSGFGAGTVDIIATCLLAFPRRDINISSKGLPIPSW